MMVDNVCYNLVNEEEIVYATERERERKREIYLPHKTISITQKENTINVS